jgi:hypothetical protein
MVSSTVRDLPEHRKAVMDACMEQGMHPVMMEHEPATTSDAARFSESLVDGAKIYVGVFAHRYGHVPEDSDISVTEIEYERAVSRNLTRLIFLMHEEHFITASSVEKGEGAVKLEAFKEKLKAELIVKEFTSAADLRAHVVNSLAKYQHGTLFTSRYVVNIPEPPAPYVAHPDQTYQSEELVGRQEDLKMLADWVSKSKKNISKARMLWLVAAGGMGKSLLAWKWFSDPARYDMPEAAGRIWWSFDNKDRFGDFIRCSLAYAAGSPLKELKSVPLGECQSRLLETLDKRPFLIVLDSFERLLAAYAHPNAESLIDSERLWPEHKGVAARLKLPKGAEHSFVGQRRLREVLDPQVSNFLLAALSVRKAKILITSRLYPVELQEVDLREKAGCRAYFLEGLSNADAVDLWRSCNASGSRRALIPLFRSFGNYPNLIRALAEKIAEYRRAQGDTGQWRQDFPDLGI